MYRTIHGIGCKRGKTLRHDKICWLINYVTTGFVQKLYIDIIKAEDKMMCVIKLLFKIY